MNIMDYKINKILGLLVLSLYIKVWKLKVYLKNICQIHPNTPIKYKYKYKYFILWFFKYKYKYKYRYLRI